MVDGANARFVDQIAARQRLRAVSSIGASFPLHCTANAKALLATLPHDQVESLLPAELERFTPNTITNRDQLLAEIEQVRRDGVAYDGEGVHGGISAVGAIVLSESGPAAAMSIPMPTSRFLRSVEQITPLLLQACSDCSLALGSRRASHGR